MTKEEAEALMRYVDARIHQYHADSHCYVSVQDLMTIDVQVKKARQDVLALVKEPVKPERLPCPWRNDGCTKKLCLPGEHDVEACMQNPLGHACGMIVLR